MRAHNIDLKGDGWTAAKVAVVERLPPDLARLVLAMLVDEFGRGFWIALRRHNDADCNLVLDFLQLIQAELATRGESDPRPTWH